MNPWTDVAPEDYEAHMTSPAVAQLAVLADILARDLAALRPRSLLVVGCATGNGLQHVDPAVTGQVVGIDINPAFLALARERFGARLPGLRLLEGDVLDPALEPGTFELVHAALILEHVPWQATLHRITSWATGDGVLSLVLQLPSAEAAPVSPTAIASRYPGIAQEMRLVDADELAALARELGWAPVASERIPLPLGKAFLAMRWQRGACRPSFASRRQDAPRAGTRSITPRAPPR